MNRALIDTDILSYYLKGNSTVVENFCQYFSAFEYIEISVITYYEIEGGLLAKNAFKKLEIFEDFISDHIIVPLTERSARISSELYATLRQSGNTVDDIDLLIAGIAIENNMTLVTNNENHFSRIPGLNIENWTKNVL